MVYHISQRENPFAKTALAQRIVTLDGFVTNLLLFDNTQATTLTNHLHVFTFIEFVGAEQKLIISQLIVTFRIIALESDLT